MTKPPHRTLRRQTLRYPPLIRVYRRFRVRGVDLATRLVLAAATETDSALASLRFVFFVAARVWRCVGLLSTATETGWADVPGSMSMPNSSLRSAPTKPSLGFAVRV